VSEEAIVPAVEPKQDQADMFLALMRQDISLLNKEERATYLATLARSMGLNPMLKPFDLIKNDRGELFVYSNISCATQLADLRKLDVETFYDGPLVIGARVVDQCYVVRVRVKETLADGRVRTTEDLGSSWIDNESGGQGLANLVAKTHTKAKRRAILRHCGVGFPDIEELDSIPSLRFEQKTEGPRLVEPSQPKALQQQQQEPIVQPKTVVNVGPGKLAMRPPVPPPLPLKR
jgi:hypothetical protein